MIDHEVDIETDELDDAALKLKSALGVVGDVPAVLEAQERLDEAFADLVNEETFEDKFTAAARHVHEVESLTNGYRAYLTAQHREGRVRVSNEEWTHVDACLLEAADACNRWIDYAEHELRDIS